LRVGGVWWWPLLLLWLLLWIDELEEPEGGGGRRGMNGVAGFYTINKEINIDHVIS
jgi:hypothetical protein